MTSCLLQFPFWALHYFQTLLPGACKSWFLADGCGENAEVIVCDLQGTPLKKFAVDASQPVLETDLSELPAGMYFCKIPNENGFYLQKFILVK